MKKSIPISNIIKFFDNKSSAQEAAEVYAYLEERPELLDSFLSLEEWEQLSISEILTEDQMVALKRGIDQEINSQSKPGRLRPLKKLWSAAAAVLLVLAGFLLYNKVSQNHIQPETLTQYFKIENRGKEAHEVWLPDSSKLILSPGAAVVYQEGYAENRVVAVLGKVEFEETQIAAKPFTVVAQEIHTRPIGTRFSVHNSLESKTVTVQLMEGLVVVSSKDSVLKMEDVYLHPGQGVIIDKNTGRVSLTQVGSGQVSAPKQATDKKSVETPQDAMTTWTNSSVKFKKAPLDLVFNKIAARYNISIEFSKEDLQSKFFTGEIYYTDAVEKLIQNICEVNNLDFIQKGDTVVLHVKQP